MAELARRSRAFTNGAATPNVLALRAGELWAFFKAQDLAYWAMCFYLIIEYVRPQQVFTAVIGWPLGQIGLGTAILAYFGTGARGFGLKGIGTWLMLLFTGVIIASSLTAFDTATSFDAIRVWYSWLVIYLLIVNLVNTRQRFAFFMLLWLMCHYYMSQGGAKQFAGRGFTFATWGIIGAPGWFANSGEFGIAMVMLFGISWHWYAATRMYLTKWRKVFVLGMPVTAAIGVVGSSSRGALVGLGAIGVCVLLRSKINPKTVIGIALVAGAAWFLLPPEQKARFSSAGEDDTSVNRKVYWLNGLDIARSHPVLGIGYENWLKFYAAYYTDSEVSNEYDVHTVQVVHNIFIQCMAELGYVGLFVFVLLILVTPVINSQTRKMARSGHDPPDNFVIHMSQGLDEAMWGYIVAGFFVTVLYYPFFWVNLALSVALNAVVRASRHTVARRATGTRQAYSPVRQQPVTHP